MLTHDEAADLLARLYTDPESASLDDIRALALYANELQHELNRRDAMLADVARQVLAMAAPS